MCCIIDDVGSKCWFNKDFVLHREGGPAIEYRIGTKCWYINGRKHREDGPAIEFHDGNRSWYYNGEFIGSSWGGFTQEKFERYLRSLKIKEYW